MKTKWSASPWPLEPHDERIDQAVQHAQRNARRLRLWVPSTRIGIADVSSAVFLWSAHPDEARPGTPVRTDRTQVYGRGAATAWRAALLDAPAVLSASQIDQLYNDIDQHLRRRDPLSGSVPDLVFERGREPMKLGPLLADSGARPSVLPEPAQVGIDGLLQRAGWKRELLLAGRY